MVYVIISGVQVSVHERCRETNAPNDSLETSC